MRNLGLTRKQNDIRNFLYIAYACIIGMAGFTLAFYFLKQTLFSRMLLLICGGISSILVFIWHVAFDKIQRSILRSGSPTYPTLIIGSNREAKNLIEKMQQAKSPFMPVAVLDGKGGGESEISGVPNLGKLNKLEEVIKQKQITHLVQCDQLEHSINFVSLCRKNNINYMLLPFVLGVIEDSVPTESLEGKQVVSIAREKSKWLWFFR
jgi:FlaA1/EpsC-like NDP-sugar epimerase